MIIQGNEKVKTQKIVSKIERGNFDENDVDGLLIKLRAFAEPNGIFKEISHFVAHNDIRNKGLTYDSLEIFYFAVQYRFTYTMNQKKFSIFKPFPTYIKKLIKYQLNRFNKPYFLQNFNIDKDELKKLIDSLFIDDSITRNSLIDLPKYLNFTSEKQANISRSIISLMSHHEYPPTYKQDDIIDSIINTLRINKLIFDEMSFRHQSNKIILCIIYLLHNTQFDIKGFASGFCKIYCTKKVDMNNTSKDNDFNFRFNNGKTSFDNLSINSYVPIDFSNDSIIATYTFLYTNLKADEWCTKEILGTSIYSLDIELGDTIDLNVNVLGGELPENIEISKDFKLSVS